MSILNAERWRQQVALDVGTATIRVAAGTSPLIEQPSRIGRRMALNDGVVVDGDAAQQILKPLLERTKSFGIVKPFILACAPSDAKKEERQLLTDSIMKAGAASISIIPEPLAAAIGAGIDISDPYARMVVDIGEGVTDCAVIRSSKIRASCAIRVGCCRMRRAVTIAAEEPGSAPFGDSYADILMRTCGITRSAGRTGSLMTALALQPVIEVIANTVCSFLKDLPHEVGCEVIHNGICLTGGGALIPGLKEYFEQRTGIGITLPADPRAAVLEGARAILPGIMMLNQWK